MFTWSQTKERSEFRDCSCDFVDRIPEHKHDPRSHTGQQGCACTTKKYRACNGCLSSAVMTRRRLRRPLFFSGGSRLAGRQFRSGVFFNGLAPDERHW